MGGSRDSRDRTWTKGERDSTRFHRNQGKPAASLDDPSPPVLRAYIADQICWWCDTGPWKCLAAHTFHAHGIKAADLRRLAFLFKTATICSEALSENYRARALASGRLPGRSETPKKRVYSEAGRESGRKRLQAWRDRVGPEEVERQRRRAYAAQRTLYAKPHPCTRQGCERIVPRASRKTCSPECRRKIRQANQLRGAAMARARRGTHCGVTGCGGVFKGRGLCTRHLVQQRKGKMIMTATLYKDIRPGQHLCRNPGCDNIVLAKKVATCSRACFKQRMRKLGLSRLAA